MKLTITRHIVIVEKKLKKINKFGEQHQKWLTIVLQATSEATLDF